MFNVLLCSGYNKVMMKYKDSVFGQSIDILISSDTILTPQSNFFTATYNDKQYEINLKSFYDKQKIDGGSIENNCINLKYGGYIKFKELIPIDLSGAL